MIALLVGAIFPARAQNSSEDRSSGLILPEVDEAKLIAQQTAMRQLVGEERYVLRESSWGGEIASGKVKLVQAQLFKRNDYRFWLAVPDRRAIVSLSIYDGRGEQVEAQIETGDSTNVSSLAISPEQTGVYYLRIALHGDLALTQRWSLIYAYR